MQELILKVSLKQIVLLR